MYACLSVHPGRLRNWILWIGFLRLFLCVIEKENTGRDSVHSIAKKCHFATISLLLRHRWLFVIFSLKGSLAVL